jgi:hypothetical protein
LPDDRPRRIGRLAAVPLTATRAYSISTGRAPGRATRA